MTCSYFLLVFVGYGRALNYLSFGEIEGTGDILGSSVVNIIGDQYFAVVPCNKSKLATEQA